LKDKKKIYGELFSDEHVDFGYAGLERAFELCKLFSDKQALEEIVQKNYDEQDAYLNNLGIYVGLNTLEIDIFDSCKDSDKDLICQVFNELTSGGEIHKDNFKNNLINGEYKKCLSSIESSHSEIGKGRFAQRLASICTQSMIPNYISEAIEDICKGVRS